ncbi:CBS domain-containing protein [Mesoterricola sediminis]|uniref:Histidine kinase n=1 Tax=Mesoterricola sediminis TaxID=2927980 RepID=A0AA48KDE0_9BACT|nr:CBS domain-containing protein [Mesoterricola sediminis]BDU76222.1 histidine kinase [Mesoterricola sediminis]
MTDMKRILDGKGYSFFFVPPEAKVIEAIRLMDQKKVGFLLVMDGERTEGVFSERDVVKLMGRTGPSVLDRPVSDVMVTEVYHVHLNTSVDECMGLMSERGIRHVPVMDGSMVVGIVSIRDIVREVVADREIVIKGLENYIESVEHRS